MNDTLYKTLKIIVGVLIAYAIYSFGQANRYQAEQGIMFDKQTGKTYKAIPQHKDANGEVTSYKWELYID